MVNCADTSFLFSLYGNDVHSAKALGWLQSRQKPLLITSLNEYELGNALRFAAFRKVIDPKEAQLYWADFEADRANGRIEVKICNLAEIVDEAKRLSAAHTISGGHRAFDILHVAAALVLKCHFFLTFDKNQKQLAEGVGLEVPFGI
jgi:predicted nucleic acid-binding protein